MKKANTEEIWRKHGWVPPSKENLQIMQRQASSRGVILFTNDDLLESTTDQKLPHNQPGVSNEKTK